MLSNSVVQDYQWLSPPRTSYKDLFGLYSGEQSSNGGSVGNSPASSPSAPIPPTSPLYSPINQAQRKKSIHELNSNYHSEETAPVQKCSHARSVHFPDTDAELVSGYSEAPQSPFQKKDEACGEYTLAVSVDEVLNHYRKACSRLGISPSSTVEKQIGYFHRVPGVRQEVMSLKGERVSHSQMEAMEEIFRKFQFDQLDFEYTFLDDDTVISLSEMIEFYDSTHKLNLSFNKQLTLRGWNAVFKAVRNCSSLQVLNLRYTSLSEKSLPALCRTVRALPQPALGCLHLENVNLAGKNLLLVVCALKTNTNLKELYLGENCLQPTDGAHLYQLIVSNTAITTLDLRNNQLQDGGVRHICDALRNAETCRRSALQALVLWNNRVSHACMDSIAAALKVNHRLETLNVGSNPLGEAGILNLKSALLQQNSNLHRLGLQSTNMNNQSAIMLAECLADNPTMVRIDLRDNPGIGSAGLLALHSAMKINSTITLLNLDLSLATPSSAKVRPYQDEFRQYYEEIKAFCERNKLVALQNISACVETDIMPIDDELEQETVKDEETQTEGDAQAVKEEPVAECSTSSEEPKKLANKFSRSASLTCAESIPDVTIQERLREMSGSTHSLDEFSNADSMRTIKKGSAPLVTASTNGPGTCTLQHKAEWGSLPSLSQSQTTPKPVVRKLRRFSVSPTSSTFEISGPKLKSDSAGDSTTRPTSLPVGIPLTSNSEHPLSSSLPNVLNFPPSITKGPGLISPVHERTSSDHVCDEEAERVREQKEKEERLRREREKKEAEEINRRMQEQLEIERSQRETDVRTVVNDLVNYVDKSLSSDEVYEETSVVERKRSLLLQASTFNEPPDPAKLLEAMQESIVETPTTPSRMISIAEELSTETDEDVVASVMRNLVRHVLRKEKDELRSTLDRRRNRMLKDRRNPGAGPSTPV